MAKFELKMPKLGESIIEATITRWQKKEGDTVKEDDSIVEIATDKVDSEIPSPIAGTIISVLFNEGDIVPVGTVIAIIAPEGETIESIAPEKEVKEVAPEPTKNIVPEKPISETAPIVEDLNNIAANKRFLSPLVKSIVKKENISEAELNNITGSGLDNRITKDDVLAYIQGAKQKTTNEIQAPKLEVNLANGDQIVVMDRMRKLIADHMVLSVKTSPHVSSFIEVDVTNLVKWREKNKDIVLKRENEKLTFTHIFIHALAQALKDFPSVNTSVDGNNIIFRKRINIGMATALPSGNLIVPVIKDADKKSLLGIISTTNDLANKARNNKLQPDDIQGGTFTLTNLGSFGSLTGTPIINQPQSAILAVGVIKKRPVVLETPEGDVIGIRQIMIASLSYDHRIVDGAMGGLFLKRFAELLEGFDINQAI
ncbi:MAG: dihydrolipoamide acetyltransferase family protein [Bacteroidota bacterium]